MNIPIKIKIPHEPKKIANLKLFNLETIFTWFNEKTILYHYYNGSSPYQTQYVNLPKGVTKDNFVLNAFDEKTNELILTFK